MTRIRMEVERTRQLSAQMQRMLGEFVQHHGQLERQISRLSGNWEGGASEDFIKDAIGASRKINQFVHEFEGLSTALSNEIDQWVAADRFDGGGFSGVHPFILGALYPGSSPAFPLDPDLPPDILGGNRYYLIDGVQIDAYARYERGEITFEELIEAISEDPFYQEVVKTKITFYEQKGERDWAVLQGGSGPLEASLLSAELAGSYGLYAEDGKLEGNAEFNAGIYAAKATVSGETSGNLGAAHAGVGMAAVGFIGAEVAGKGGFVFDPKNSELGASAELEAFAGGKIEGDAYVTGGIDGVGDAKATVSGGLSYGIGGTAKADIGFSPGKIKGELKLGLTVGLGAEVGINFDIDVSEGVGNVVNAAQSAGDVLFGFFD